MNEVEPGMLAVRLKPGMVSGSANGVGILTTIPGAYKIRTIAKSQWTLWRVPETASPQALAQLAMRDPKVSYAEPVNKIYPLGDPNDGDFNSIVTDSSEPLDNTQVIIYFGDDETQAPTFRRLWHLDDTNAMGAWSIWPNTWYTSATKPANCPTIAVVDSGCDMNHPDFINSGGSDSNITHGGQLDWAHSQQFTLGAIDPNGTPEDSNGHGTHVTGLALAAGNNGSFNGEDGQPHGVIGTGYAAKGMILRVFGTGGVGDDSDAAAAIYYAADNGADIISLSLGTTNYSQLFQDAVTYAFQKGSLVVCAGNENGNGGGELGPIYPAACSGALGVTADGPDLVPATVSYAGQGTYVDIGAPGGDFIENVDSLVIQYMWSTTMRTPGELYALNPTGQVYPYITLNYGWLAGTSMATPVVSGAASLYYGKNGLHQSDGYTNLRVYRALETSAIGVMGAPYGGWETTQGYGALDIQGLLQDASPRAPQVGGVEGIVYYFGTPVSNVAVKAKLTNNSGVTYSTTTMADGTYRFEGMPAGVYNVTASPFGATKTKKALIKLGSDLPGLDFWCGTYDPNSLPDGTPPVVAKFQVVSNTSSTIDVKHWGYDTETGIDSIVFRVGTSQGGSDVMGDTEIVVDSNVAHLTGLSLSSGVTYWVRGTYKNGVGMTTVVDTSFGTQGPLVSGTVTLQDYSGSLPMVQIDLRTPGTQTVVETHTVQLGTGGTFSFHSNHQGSFDIAAKCSHWLRKDLPNRTIGTGGLSGLTYSLINGDIDGDNAVSLRDYSAFTAAYRSRPGDTNWNPNADLNGDGAVSLTDYGIFNKNFGKRGD